MTTTNDFLHENLILRSDKQTSAQGSVFYVKKNEGEDQSEYILKIYKNEDLKSYLLEKRVLEALQRLPDCKGFPRLVSTKEGSN